MELKFVLLILLSSLHMDYSEQPLSSCSDFNKPYKTMNNSCSNFKEVCVKTGDKECDIFQSVCKQCPSSNFSILMYLDMINMKDQMTSMKTNDLTKIGNNLIVLYVFDGLIFLLLLFLFLEIVFKIFTKCCLSQPDHNGREYRSIPSSLPKKVSEHQLTPLNQQNVQYNQLTEKTSDLLNIEILKMENSLKESLENLFKSRNNIKFKISGATRPIELSIRPNENVLQVKRQICSHWPAAKPGDYKIMIIKFKCKPLNDHYNFLSYNIPTNATLDCELDNKLNPDDFLILKLQATLDLPEMLKFSKEKTISELKTFITNYSEIKSDPIIREMKTGQEIKNDTILRKSRLQDDDWIDIITENNKKLIARSMFNKSESCEFRYFNIDMILDIKNIIKSKLNLRIDNIILFWDNLHLEDEKYIQDYNINDEFPIKFCYLNILEEMQIRSRNIIKNDFYTLTKGCHSGNDVYIQRYKLKENVSIIKSSNFKNQLITYQIINSHIRFMSLYRIFLDKTDLYVFLDNNLDEVIVEVIKNSILTENEIAKWSMQILNGLKQLHDNNIVHKNLKPTSIFVDSYRNIKLSCFNMIGSLSDDEYIIAASELIINYWSPEVFKFQQFSNKSDVWSFGAVLYFLITKKPFPKLDENYTYNKTEYCNLEVSKELQDFLNQCLIENPKERPDVDALLKHSFLEMSK